MGSGVALGDRAAFSVATIDSGRLRGRSEDCEVGRLCHERGEFFEGGMALEGEALIEETLLRPAISLSISMGAVYSLVGEVEVPMSRRASESSRCGAGSILGDSVWDKELACSTATLDVVGVFEGEDLVGEMDLARSELHLVSQRVSKQDEQHVAVKSNGPTGAASLSFLSALQNLFLQLPISLLVFLVSSVAQFLDALQEIIDVFRIRWRGRHLDRTRRMTSLTIHETI